MIRFFENVLMILVGMLMCYSFFVFYNPLVDELWHANNRIEGLEYDLKVASEEQDINECEEVEEVLCKPDIVYVDAYIESECYCDDEELNTTKSFLDVCHANKDALLEKNEELVYKVNVLGADLKECKLLYPWSD